MPLIFQYGSNCDTSEINNPERLDGRATDLGRARTTEEFEFAFTKWSLNRNCAAVDIVGPAKGRQHIWGVLLEISGNDLVKLAEVIEGPSYEPLEVRVEDASGKIKAATTFVVKRDRRRKGLWTSAEYVRHIVSGLRSHGVPEDHVQYVIATAIETNEHAEANAAEQIREIKTL